MLCGNSLMMGGCLYKPRKAKHFQQPPEAGKDKKRFSPRAFAENMALPTPKFQTPRLQNLRELISVVLSHPAVGTLLWQSHKLLFLTITKGEEKKGNSLAIPGRGRKVSKGCVRQARADQQFGSPDVSSFPSLSLTYL